MRTPPAVGRPNRAEVDGRGLPARSGLPAVDLGRPVHSRLQADCVRELAAYQPPAVDQQHLREDFLRHLADRVAGWSRDCPGAHLTASALVCSPSADQVLLVRHRKLKRWLQTGGHLEPEDSTLAAAARREAREESGLSGLVLLPGIVHLDRHEVPCGPVRPCFHLDVRYVVLADPATRPPGNAESVAVRWFDRTDLPTREPSVTVLVDLAHARLG